ncbi:MAG: polysaccharide deacetylase family protein [Clostridia bacterium]|nr:polysaccharide deacetylase family protein [Clostridia bacterium]
MKFGNHSNTHPHVNNLTYEKNVSEIEECSKKIESITNKKPVLYRGPYGEYNNTVLKAAESLNNKTIQWNLDTLDYNGLTGEEMWNRIGSKLTNGSIILSHNGTKHTADSLEYLINNIKNSGYEIVPVSDLIYQSDYYIDSTGAQIKK